MSTATGNRPMSRDELVTEARWLLEGGTHPHMVAQMLRRQPQTVLKAARLKKAEDVLQAFLRVHQEEHPPPWSPR